MRWVLGALALALWIVPPHLAAQQQFTRHRRHRPARHAARGSARDADAGQRSGSDARRLQPAHRVPQGGTPTLENPRPAGRLGTLPNQTLTPGANTVPSNSGAIAPASNAASSGEYTPSEGYSAPTTPGGNPSNTQGVPTFSSAAQPPAANLPRTIAPARSSLSTAKSSSKSKLRPR